MYVAHITCGMIIKTLLPSTIVVVNIPAGAAIEGPTSTWTKVMIPPIPVTVPTALLPAPPSGLTNQIALAIEVGHKVAPLDITRGTRIFISGQAGKKIGYIFNNIFTEITDLCTDDSQAVGDALAAGQSCKIENGSDLIIWTKHFSEFVIYSLIPSSPSITPSVSRRPTVNPTLIPTVTETPIETPTETPIPTSSPVLFDIVSTPVQSTQQSIISLIALSCGILLLILLVIFVVQRIRKYMYEKKIKNKAKVL